MMNYPGQIKLTTLQHGLNIKQNQIQTSLYCPRKYTNMIRPIIDYVDVIYN